LVHGFIRLRLDGRSKAPASVKRMKNNFHESPRRAGGVSLPVVQSARQGARDLTRELPGHLRVPLAYLRNECGSYFSFAPNNHAGLVRAALCRRRRRKKKRFADIDCAWAVAENEGV
jgi:hypothetical protein